MAPVPGSYVAWTSPINPPGAEPALSREQVWAALKIKVEEAQIFVPAAILSTDVIEKKEDEHGHPVTVREVVFKEGNRRVREEVVHYEPTKVVFLQTDGSQVQNIISNGADGGLYMTYDFTWLHPGMDDATLAEKIAADRKASQKAVDSSIQAIRELVKSGRIPA